MRERPGSRSQYFKGGDADLARPPKDGVDYFPLDVDFLQDDKIRLLKAEFGTKGITIIIALLCEIYRGNGYFKVWDNDCCLLMADAVGCGIVPENITQVVQGCLRRSFFDEGVFQMFGILTSAGIQRRYIRAVSTRDEIQMIKEYWLLDANDQKDVPAGARKKIIFKQVNLKKTTDKLKENPDDLQINPQSKGKESKGEESKGKDNMSGPAPAPPDRRLFISLILNDGTEHPVYQDQADKWSKLYPAVDVFQELRKMAGWCEANPKRRKTKRGILNFINSWLSREQDKGGSRNGNASDRNSENPSGTPSQRGPLGTVI